VKTSNYVGATLDSVGKKEKFETPLRQMNMSIPRQAMTSNSQQQQRLKLRPKPNGTDSQTDSSIDHAAS
jgi:hypothetical protein